MLRAVCAILAALAGSVASAPCAWTHGVNYWGHDIIQLSAASREDCCGQCQANRNCVAITFVNRTCYLKANATNVRPCGDCVSAVVRDASKVHQGGR